MRWDQQIEIASTWRSWPYRTGSVVLAVARTPQMPIGVIGYSAAPDRTRLLHLATDPVYRQRGIGTALIHWAHARRPDIPLVAETDADAVRFYEKSGFTCTSLGEKYPGVERFLVRRPRPATRHIGDRHSRNDRRVR